MSNSKPLGNNLHLRQQINTAFSEKAVRHDGTLMNRSMTRRKVARMCGYIPFPYDCRVLLDARDVHIFQTDTKL
jgi:hypothetical protein